ncbi:MAG TPA: copper chaperone PCu(A)C [Arenimonas sp.]|nr:copper chaperone PCu(A)C [Arenimonas sp.]
MKRTLITSTLLSLVLAFSAQATAKSTLQVSNAWIRATPPNATVAGGFMSIKNVGAEDRLLSVTSTAAKSVEIHEMSMQGDVMQMRQLTDGLVIPANINITLKPGGIHLMFITPKYVLSEGQKITATLLFAKAGKQKVEFTIHKQAPSESASEHTTH